MTPEKMILLAIKEPDKYSCQIAYIDAKGDPSVRIISPIRFLDDGTVEAMCLCRQSVRHFLLENMVAVRLVRSDLVLAPVRIGTFDVDKCHQVPLFAFFGLDTVEPALQPLMGTFRALAERIILHTGGNCREALSALLRSRDMM